MPPVLAMLTDGLSISMTILRGLSLSYGGPQAVLVRRVVGGVVVVLCHSQYMAIIANVWGVFVLGPCVRTPNAGHD